MVVGPRLDRPSAVGDEGRPRETSLTLAAAVVVVIALAIGVILGDFRTFAGVGLFVGLTVAGIALLQRDRLGPTVVGHLCFLPGAVFLLVAIGITPVETILTVGIAIALFGVATAWSDVLDASVLTETLESSALAYGFALVGVVVLTLCLSVVALGWLAVEAITTSNDPGYGLAVGLVLVGLDTACAYLAVRALPIAQLSAHERREVTKRRTNRYKRVLSRATAAMWGAVPLVLILLLMDPFRSLLSLPPFSIALLLVTSRVVVFVLLGVAVLAILIASGSYILRRVASEIYETNVRSVGAQIAAVCYLTLVLSGLLLPFSWIPGPAFALGGILLPLGVYLLLALLVLASRVGIVPGREGSLGLCAAGLITAGIGVALTSLPTILVFVAVVGGLVAWDVGTYGLGVTAELGHIPDTRRMELYHGLFSIGVGLLGIAAVTTVDALRQSVGSGVGTPTTMTVAVVGVLLLLVPLRG